MSPSFKETKRAGTKEEEGHPTYLVMVSIGPIRIVLHLHIIQPTRCPTGFIDLSQRAGGHQLIKLLSCQEGNLGVALLFVFEIAACICHVALEARKRCVGLFGWVGGWVD